MSLEKVLAISGKPGLYKLITQTRGGFIAESLLDKKRLSVNIHQNVSVLSEIAIYTLTEEVPLREVFKKIKEKHIENLIIDLRFNGGGSAESSIYLLKYLAKKPFAYLDSYGIQNPFEDRYNGNLFFLIDGHGKSTTGHFMALAKEETSSAASSCRCNSAKASAMPSSLRARRWFRVGWSSIRMSPSQWK